MIPKDGHKYIFAQPHKLCETKH